MLTINGAPGLPPKLAVPDFIPLSSDAETVAAAKDHRRGALGRPELRAGVLPDSARHLQEHPAGQVGRRQCRSIGGRSSTPTALVVGTVRRDGNRGRRPGAADRRRARAVPRSPRSTAGASELANPRLYAHTTSDEIHQQQRSLRGVARTKLAFSSDRDGERMKGPVADRDISKIYISDYDGANPQRVTITRTLNIAPAWSPDVKAIAYTSYRTGFPDIIVPIHLRGEGVHEAGQRRLGREAELPAGVVAGRHQAGVHVEPRRQPGDLRHEPGRQRPAAARRTTRRSTCRRRGRRPATRSRGRRTVPARRRSTIMNADGSGRAR